MLNINDSLFISTMLSIFYTADTIFSVSHCNSRMGLNCILLENDLMYWFYLLFLFLNPFMFTLYGENIELL